MYLSRMMLLITGIVSSVAVATVMCISAEGALVPDRVPSAITEPSALENPVIQPEVKLCVYESSFPMAVSGTTLVAQRLALYDGRFAEDGSDREVVNVIAMEVKNVGEAEILKVHIELRCEGNTLNFFGEHIPSGSSVLLIERNCKKNLQGRITGCTGLQIASEKESFTEQQVLVCDKELGSITVTNLTEKPIYNIRIYYKGWITPPGIYIGGTAYRVKIQSLKPGETISLHPEYYAVGYSKVVSVTGDT